MTTSLNYMTSSNQDNIDFYLGWANGKLDFGRREESKATAFI